MDTSPKLRNDQKKIKQQLYFYLQLQTFIVNPLRSVNYTSKIHK